MVCLTPRAVEFANVDGRVVFVGDVLFGLGVAETVGAEVVVKALRLASVVLWLLGLSVKVFVPDDRLGMFVELVISEETIGLPVTVFAPKEETLELSVNVFEKTSGLVEAPDPEPDPVMVMDAVTVSVTVTAGHVLSVPWAVVKAVLRENIRAAVRRDLVQLDIILPVITND